MFTADSHYAIGKSHLQHRHTVIRVQRQELFPVLLSLVKLYALNLKVIIQDFVQQPPDAGTACHREMIEL